MKIVHAADLHLDSPLKGLVRYDSAPVHRIKSATRRALENLVELCLQQEAQLLLLAGDIYDGNWRDYSTGLFLLAELARLREANVQVLLVHGNHDAASRITKHLSMPENVFTFGHRRPQTKEFEELGVAVHGQSFAERAVTEDLARGYPSAQGGMLNIGLLHTALSGRVGHEPYAPTTPAILSDKGYDYWALGHVHQREIVKQDPWIVFPGNLQGRHAREQGAKGASVLEVNQGRVHAVEHVPLDVVRFCELKVGSTELRGRLDLLDQLRAEFARVLSENPERVSAVRVSISGAGAVHDELCGNSVKIENELRLLAAEVGQESLWVERLKLQTSTAAANLGLEHRDDAIAAIVEAVGRISNDRAELSGFEEEFKDFIARLPSELSASGEGISWESPQFWQGLGPEVEKLIVSRLLEEKAPA